MKHFLGFLAFVFSALFLLYINNNEESEKSLAIPTLRVFGYASFTGQYGPGPFLKETFEKQCQCHVEYYSGPDSGIIMQRLKIEGESLGADLIIGLDQYDLNKALAQFRWRKLNISNLDFDPLVKPAFVNPYFVPYDWGVLSFVARKDGRDYPKNLNDLLAPEWQKKIALEDPRTSSPGLQFLMWVLKSKGQEEGFRFLGQLMKRAHSFSSSWSSAYGLFSKGQVDIAFSYVTSPLYHQIVEKDLGYQALEFDEPLPIQFEYFGVPEFCKQCALAEKFVNLMLSPEGQREIMMKNYMFPVLPIVKDGTEFAQVKIPKTISQIDVPAQDEVDRLLKKWAETRRGE